MAKLSYKWKEWLIAALVRAVRTMAETAIAVIGTAAVVSEVNWGVVAGSCALSGILTVLLALKGLPEVDG